MNRLMSSTEGQARVMEKYVRDSVFIVRCEVEVTKIQEEDSPGPLETIVMEDLVVTDQASFDLVKEGATIRVWYRVDKKYSKMRIYRMILDRTVIPTGTYE